MVSNRSQKSLSTLKRNYNKKLRTDNIDVGQMFLADVFDYLKNLQCIHCIEQSENYSFNWAIQSFHKVPY